MTLKSLNNEAIFEKKKRFRERIKDFFSVTSTYIFSSFTLIALIAIIVFIFSRGYSTLSWDFITGDYNPTTYVIRTDTESDADRLDNTFDYTPREGEYFSSLWGIGFMNEENNVGEKIVVISYVDPNANINNIVDADNNPFTIEAGTTVNSALLYNDEGRVSIRIDRGAEEVAKRFDECPYILQMSLTTGGDGIRGSFISTLYMIGITMVIALPLGISAAIYLGVYAKENKITKMLRNMIDMISGIPSIIFGLVGGIIFLPIVGGNGNLISGSLTMAFMILPLIIKTTQESIKTIPKSLSDASLALGASQTQTTFKVILPNSLPGILTSALLGISRVIGESAALIYTSGVAILDTVSPTQGSATLAVHIWSLMSGETQNYEASCAISIIILIIILLLSIIIKLISLITERKKRRRG